MSLLLLTWLALAGGGGPVVPVGLQGSPASMERQHQVALESGYDFFRTASEVRAAVSAGQLVRLVGGESFAVKESDMGVTRPEVRHFVEGFADAYRAGCGERLVVTSLTRASTRQPGNAHRLSVHPAGMAIDLRVPKTARCRRWLEDSLLGLERAGVLDATRERRPPHYHVAVFPAAYLAHLERDRIRRPEVVAAETRIAFD